jgi:TonB family protein
MTRRARNDEKSGLPRAGVLSLLLHIALIIALGFSAKLVITEVVPSVYRVAIRPFSRGGDGMPPGSPGPGPAETVPVPPAVEKPKPEEGKKPVEAVAAEKPEQKKAEVTAEKPAKAEKPAAIEKPEEKTPPAKAEKPAQAEVSLAPKKEQTPVTKKDQQLAAGGESDRSLQEAIEEIRRRVAIEEIRKRVAEREGTGQGSTGAGTGPSQGPIVASAGGGAGSGTGPGTGGGGGTPEQVYGTLVEARIKKEWALPENFRKEKSQLEAIIIVIIQRDGRVQKAWFEKASGSASYDQMAMRAIKKAEPLPSFLSGMTEDTVAIGIRFQPD